MTRYQLSFDDLVSGLEFFGDQYGGYEALDVFTRDLQKVGRTLMKGGLVSRGPCRVSRRLSSSETVERTSYASIRWVSRA